MKFNIIIPTHCRTDLLNRTLKSLVNAEKPEYFENIIIIENGANNGANKICKKYETKLPLIYKHQVKPGKGRALQAIIEKLKYGFVLFLDDDVRVCNDLLMHYAESIHQHGKGYIYGGPLLVDYEVEPENWLKEFLPNSVTGWSISDNTVPYINDGYFLGANFGAFIEDILYVGGFSKDIGPGSHMPGTEGNPTGVERELQDRLMNAGVRRLYIPNAKVWHFVPSNNCTPLWALHRSYRNGMLTGFLNEKKNPARTLFLFNLPVILLMLYPIKAIGAIISFFIPHASTQFKLKRAFYKLRGEIKGHQLAKKIIQ